MSSPQTPRQVLVVCYGNICRSPVGEHLLRYLYDKSPLKETNGEIKFISAGIEAGNGWMSPNSVRYLSQFKIDGSHFRAQPTTRELLDASDLILVMEEYMKDHILKVYYQDLPPEQLQEKADQILVFTDSAEKTRDIEDPYGENYLYYKRVLDEIKGYAQKWIKRWENKYITNMQDQNT